MSDAPKGVQHAVRGNNRLLIGGVAAVTAGLGLFWYAQKANQVRKEAAPQPGAIPTWEYRLAQEQEPATSNSDQQLAHRPSGEDFRPRPESVPRRDNHDQSGSQGPAASALDATQGKSSDGHQNPKSELAPQREKVKGSEVASK